MDLLWVIRHTTLANGVAPMPAEVKERSRRNAYYLLFLQYALLCTLLWVLMARYSVSASSIGLSLRHWETFGVIGAVAGTGKLAYSALVTRVLPRPPAGSPPRYPGVLIGRSGGQEILLLAVSSFVEEFWRAFCLVCFLRLGHGPVFAVVVTSFAFALAHREGRDTLVMKVGRVWAHSISGAYYAVFFLWCHSIVVTWVAHLLYNSVRSYQARRTRDA
jgi:membrane protease YdiL (CAAX protease family)